MQRTSYPAHEFPPGEQMQEATQALFEAIARVEAAIDEREEDADDEESSPLHAVRKRCSALEHENAELHDELKAVQERHAVTSAQVKELSARLDGLVDRLSQLLSE